MVNNMPRIINIQNKNTLITKQFESVEEFSDYLLELNTELYYASYFYDESICCNIIKHWRHSKHLSTSSAAAQQHCET